MKLVKLETFCTCGTLYHGYLLLALTLPNAESCACFLCQWSARRLSLGVVHVQNVRSLLCIVHQSSLLNSEQRYLKDSNSR